MPTRDGSRGSNGCSERVRVSYRVTSGTDRSVPPPLLGRLREMQDLSARVADAFHTLPARYLGAEPGFDATYHVRLGDIGRSWEIRCTAIGARVRAGASRRTPDVVIGTDAETWLQLRQGELSGVEAFSQRRLYARGDLDLAVGFEGLFRLPSGRPPLLKIHHVPVGRLKLSTLTIGRGPDMLLLHGLGATKS